METMMNDADTMATCANCGKGEESIGDLKACTACHLVKYCNRECQIAHRPKHKKACKKRAAELHEEALFKEPPPPEDCPICFQTLPLDGRQSIFQSCCGKRICNGCTYAIDEEARGRGVLDLCAFCRVTNPSSDEEIIKQLQKLIEAKNADACCALGGYYERGNMGMPQDFAKANELWLRAAEIGCANAYYNLGLAYDNGWGVEVDKKKAKHFFELAAINGNVTARNNLGCMEFEAGNHYRGIKHYIIAAKAGDKASLDPIKNIFMKGFISKHVYANILRANQRSQDETKSDQRDKAARML